MKTRDYWIKTLGLEDHPEGGYFKETYRSTEIVLNRNGKKRAASTGIYFLITQEAFSAFHKIESDEMWHYHAGDALEVVMIHKNGEVEVLNVGPDIEKGQRLQAVVPAGCWFGSRVVEGGDYSLVGCTVAPGFDFEDFVLANRVELTNEFPQHADLIESLTRK